MAVGSYESHGTHFLIRAPRENEAHLPESVSIFQHKTLVAVMSKSCVFMSANVARLADSFGLLMSKNDVENYAEQILRFHVKVHASSSKASPMQLLLEVLLQTISSALSNLTSQWKVTGTMPK